MSIKIIPGNVSSAKVYKHLQNSKHGLLMFESEADTVSTMLKHDWGNFSDVLRKVFHHEAVSISRQKDDTYFDVPNPKLSLVISGTPNQVKPLIQSKENGLFSRFLFYYFNDSVGWKDVSPNNTQIDYSELFSSASNQMLRLYGKLIINNIDVEIKLSQIQWKRFNETMDYVVNAYIESNSKDVLPILKRHGLMLFRICMILSMIRHINDDTIESSIECNDEDFETSLAIIKFSVDQAISVSNILSDKEDLGVKEILLLTSLNSEFTRSEAVNLREKLAVSERTIANFLNRLIALKKITRLTNGNYQKI